MSHRDVNMRILRVQLLLRQNISLLRDWPTATASWRAAASNSSTSCNSTELCSTGYIPSQQLRPCNFTALWSWPSPAVSVTDFQPVDIKSRWRHNWKSVQVVNSHLVCDLTIWQLGFDLPRQQWSLLNRFCMEQTLQCLQKEMATYRHWSVSLWGDPDNVPHCWIMSPDKTEWRLISATLCGWRRCFVADQLWFMTCIREEEVWQTMFR